MTTDIFQRLVIFVLPVGIVSSNSNLVVDQELEDAPRLAMAFPFWNGHGWPATRRGRLPMQAASENGTGSGTPERQALGWSLGYGRWTSMIRLEIGRLHVKSCEIYDWLDFLIGPPSSQATFIFGSVSKIVDSRARKTNMMRGTLMKYPQNEKTCQESFPTKPCIVGQGAWSLHKLLDSSGF